MSSRTIKLLDLFSGTRTVREEKETQAVFSRKYDTPPITVPDAQQLKDVFDSFPKRDKVSLSVVIGGGETTSITSGEVNAIKAQLDQLRVRRDAADADDTGLVVLTITKSPKEGKATLYSPDLFLKHLEGSSITDRLGIFNDFIKETSAIKFVCDEQLDRFGSKTITFDAESEDSGPNVQIDREALLAKRDEIAHFVNGASYKLLPEDFNLIELGTSERWQGIFEGLTNALAVAFTVDYSTFLDGNTLNFKINGYKTLTGSFNCTDLLGDNWTAAFKIYEWTYQGGSISDKAGLLRNVLSLYLDITGRPRYDQGVYKSVCSGFAIYLKRNVQQYIETKNKLSDFLRNLSNEALGEVEKYTDALKGTLGALITFFISTMILSAVGGKGLLGIFTTDVTYLTYAFLAGSVLYLGLSLILLTRKRKTIEGHYFSLKGRYNDILDKDDLERIFQNDQPFKDIDREMICQAVLITVAWVMVTLILGAVAFTLHRKEPLLRPATTQEIKSTPATQGQEPSLKNEH